MAAEYYILKPAVDTTETGNAYPAVESIEGYDFNATNSVHKLKSREFPDFEPDIRFNLAKEAQLCDILSQATINAIGLIASPNFIKLISTLNSIPYKLYPTFINDNNIIKQYSWCHFIWKERFDVIDYKATEFYITENAIKKTIPVNTSVEFKQKRKDFGFFTPLQTDNLVLKPIDFDIFISPLKTDLLISQKTKSLIESKNISGISFHLWDQ